MLSWWGRLPKSLREWMWRLVLFPVAMTVWTFVSQQVGTWQDFATENWGWALLAGALLATITWAVIEALRLRLMQRGIGATTGQASEGSGEITVVEPVYVPEDHIKRSVTQEPVLPTPELFIEGSEFEFGEPGKRGYPESKIGAASILRVSVYLNTTNGMQVECIELEVQGKRILSSWESHAVYGVPSGMYIYFEIPPEITPGLHQAKLVALANGKWWRSPDYPITFPA